MHKRQFGYYWVSLISEEDNGLEIVWKAALWDGENWCMAGDDCYYDDNELDEIDETPITRQS